MFLKKIQVEEFRCLHNVEINFSAPKYNYFGNLNVSVLVGENGCGKSSILQLLVDAFVSEKRRLKQPKATRLSIEYDIDGKEITYTGNSTYPDYHPSKVIVSSFSVFDPYQLRIEFPIRKRIKTTEEDTIYDKPKYLYCGASEGGHSTLEPVIRPILQTLFIPKTDKKKIKSYYELLNVINCSMVEGFVVNMDQLRRLESYANENVTNEEEKRKILEYCMRLFEYRRKNRNERLIGMRHFDYFIHVQQFGEELFEVYNWIEELGLDPCIRDVVFMNNTDQIVLLSDLSSGEVTMLFRFLPLIIGMEDNSLVLIDEPETHLHPRWIREFIWRLTNIFKDYKAHILIATHSPTIASDVPMECIIGLKKNEGHIFQYRPKDRTLGGYPSEILRDVFELNQLSGINALGKIEYINMLLETENPSQTQINEACRIYEDLSTNIDKYKLYQKYKVFLGD